MIQGVDAAAWTAVTAGPVPVAWDQVRQGRRYGGQRDHQHVTAVARVVTLPTLVRFAFRQRSFIEGIAWAGLTG